MNGVNNNQKFRTHFQFLTYTGEFRVATETTCSLLNTPIERAFGVLKMKWRILLAIPHFHDPLTQTKIITACMCLHNFIRDSNLYDEHFDRFERCPYVHEDSASYTGGSATASFDSVMAARRQSIAEGIA